MQLVINAQTATNLVRDQSYKATSIADLTCFIQTVTKKLEVLLVELRCKVDSRVVAVDDLAARMLTVENNHLGQPKLVDDEISVVVGGQITDKVVRDVVDVAELGDGSEVAVDLLIGPNNLKVGL